jgi:hypothetical protein
MTNLKPGDEIEGRFRATVVHTEPSGVMVRFDYQTPGLWLGTIPGLIVEKVTELEEAKVDAAEQLRQFKDWRDAAGVQRDMAMRMHEVQRHRANRGEAERDRALAAIRRVEALCEEWRYKGEFGWGAWQEGEGPDHEGYVLDGAATQIRAALAPQDGDSDE